ncbi:CPBP family intramembrane glutamic endopeptidase [Streptococcus infantis]|uniref:CPBP family intramembrane glutamic endopeptidase n=1 Tax=Streptococcus infantis TaxID=68892 RepID=UPI001BDAD4CB|nr:type II CAAX endopeptidase family protein [Streptococcus infantis]MBT0951602.1 CPBP family intramembrane metalloprotease [Streptococcus infantis]
MKTLKNIGWFALAFLSFFIVYSLTQVVGLVAMKMGVPDYVAVPIYILLAGIFTFFTYKWYQTGTVTIEQTALNKHIWLPALVLVLVIVAQTFLPNDPSVNQQTVEQLTHNQPLFSFFMVVVFAPLTEELTFRGMLARYVFPQQDNVKQTVLFLLVSTIIFALVHFPGTPQQFLVYASLGFSLGLAYISKGGLAYSMALHALNNLIGFLMIIML